MDTVKAIREFFNENPRMLFVVALAAVVAAAAGWWIYSGSSVGVNQFFAATPFNQCPYVDRGNPECGCTVTQTGQTAPNKVVIPHVCTRAFQEGDTDYSDQQWFVWDQQGGNRSCPNGDPYLTERIRADGSTFGTPLGCVEKPPDCPEGYYAFDKGGQRYCYEGTPGGGGGGGGGGGTTPTPTAIATMPVTCNPASQIVPIGQSAYIQAGGGNGAYTWATSGGGVQEDGGTGFVAYSYQVPGGKSVTVRSGGASALCTVTVQAAPTVAPTNPPVTPIPTNPASNGALVVQKLGLNVTRGETNPVEQVTAAAGQSVQFIIRVTVAGGQSLNNVVVKDAVPAGMSYLAGSTYVDGVRNSSDAIIVGGLPIGIVPAGTSFIVRWAAQVNPGAPISQQQPSVLVTADSTPSASDTMLLNIVPVTVSVPPGTSSGASGVSTGPGDAVTLALLVSVAVTLLYTAYTRSPEFRKKEVQAISRDQGPLDFRG